METIKVECGSSVDVKAVNSVVKRSRRSISLQDKVDIINQIRSGATQMTVATLNGLSRRTVQAIWAIRTTIEENYKSFNPNSKKQRRCAFEKVDMALLQWFRKQRTLNVPVKGPELLNKAKDIARQLGVEKFKGSSGWLDKWKHRHGIAFRAAVPEEPSTANSECIISRHEFSPNEMGSICVLGAGVVGLSTAVQLAQHCSQSGGQVTLIADKFEADTLSNGAGGIFRLSPSTRGPRPESLNEWIRSSRQYYMTLLRSEDCGAAGIQEVSGYMLFTNEKSLEIEMQQTREVCPAVRALSRVELDQFPGSFKGGMFFTTFLVDCKYYLPYLMEKFKMLDGQIIRRTVGNLAELSEYDVVVNCTGLGAAELVNDTRMVPLRGQVYRVNAPWIKHFYYSDLDTYILPSTDTIVLGGTRQYHSSNTNIDRYDSASIWERCSNLIPSLKDATVVKEWVGLRPHRDSVRVEAEIINTNSGKLKVVHNYGHGGYGVALSWGSSEEAVGLVKTLIYSEVQSKL